ncbi:hypothetical protein TKK_0005873 [Trichogramma kaykai]
MCPFRYQKERDEEDDYNFNDVLLEKVEQITRFAANLCFGLGRTRYDRIAAEKRGDPNLTNATGETSLRILCQREVEDDLTEIFFDVNKDINQLVKVDAREWEWGRHCYTLFCAIA